MREWMEVLELDAFRVPFSIAAGAIAGSFLNVVIHRLPRRQSLVRPGSACPSCGAPVRWWRNIPILSFLMLRGRCASCSKRISFRYPLIEGVTVALFLAACLKHGLDLTLVMRDWPMLSVFVAVAAIDLEHRIIPDRLNLVGALIGVASAMLDRELGYLGVALGGVVGFGMFYGFAWLYHSVTGRSGLGGGDIKFLGAAGFFLGPAGVFWTIFLSSIAGSVVGIAIALWQSARHKSADGEGEGENDAASLMRVSIPYGPFLVAGCIAYYFFRESFGV